MPNKLENLFAEYLKINFYIIFQITDEQNQVEYTVSFYESKSGNIRLLNSYNHSFLSNEILEKLVEKSPVFLAIKGKGILEKKVHLKEGFSDEDIVKSVIPNANSQEFYVSQYALDESLYNVAISRKKNIDSILNSLISDKVNLCGLFLGEQKIDETFKVTLLNSKSHSDGVPKEISKNFENFLFDFKSRKIVLFGLLSLLSVLIISNLVYLYLNNKITTYDEIISNNSLVIQSEKNLKNKYADIKSLTAHIGGVNRSSHHALMVDDLLVDLPPKIDFHNLEINKKREDTDTLLFFESNIHILGTTNTSYTLNEWINLLKAKKWIKNIHLKSFKQEENSNFGQFEIEVKY